MDDDIWGYVRERAIDVCGIYYKGCKRTGCVGCGFGCYNNDDIRFRVLYQLYPKYYDMIMAYTNNGCSYRDALRKVLAVTGKELPDESGELLFPL